MGCGLSGLGSSVKSEGRGCGMQLAPARRRSRRRSAEWGTTRRSASPARSFGVKTIFVSTTLLLVSTTVLLVSTTIQLIITTLLKVSSKHLLAL